MEHVEQLIVDLKESLEREFRSEVGSLRQEMREAFSALTNRFDDQAARLDRRWRPLQ